jgi:putative spermidine/putrescine transport system permease protein
MAAAGKLDPAQEEAARTLGASPLRTLFDVIIPAMVPALVSTGAICFATSIGAFGTAFTLATEINVLPIVIYTEFTLSANIATAAMLSVVLGLVTWLTLFLARIFSGAEMAGGGA